MRAWILAAAVLMVGAGNADHPYLLTVERFRAAREANDVETMRSLLSEDSRIWFGEKSGVGRPRNVDGGGPWSRWDDLFRSQTTILDTHLEGRTLRTTVSEINDWYRLVERPASTYYVTYEFDETGRIEGTLIHAIPDQKQPEPRDRLAEFEAWARRVQPGLLDVLMPEDEIDPAQASLWKEKLLQWRADSNLPNPLAVSEEASSSG